MDEEEVHAAVAARRLGAVPSSKVAAITHEGWGSAGRPIARRVTWDELDAMSDTVAAQLIKLLMAQGPQHTISFSLRSKPRVALLAGNSGEWLAAALGVSKVKAVLVPLNTRWSPPEVAAVLADSGATVILHDGAAQTLLDEALRCLASSSSSGGSSGSGSSISSGSAFGVSGGCQCGSGDFGPKPHWSVLLPPRMVLRYAPWRLSAKSLIARGLNRRELQKYVAQPLEESSGGNLHVHVHERHDGARASCTPMPRTSCRLRPS